MPTTRNFGYFRISELNVGAPQPCSTSDPPWPVQCPCFMTLTRPGVTCACCPPCQSVPLPYDLDPTWCDLVWSCFGKLLQVPTSCLNKLSLFFALVTARGTCQAGGGRRAACTCGRGQGGCSRAASTRGRGEGAVEGTEGGGGGARGSGAAGGNQVNRGWLAGQCVCVLGLQEGIR